MCKRLVKVTYSYLGFLTIKSNLKGPNHIGATIPLDTLNGAFRNGVNLGQNNLNSLLFEEFIRNC